MDSNEIWKSVCAVRESAPLIHSITNYVVMNSTANALLAIGASPIMAHAPEEMQEIVSIAGGLVLNIGTLSAPWIESMVCAGKYAHKRAIPIMLDPVGAGASRLRTETAMRLINTALPSVIRGNGSEIMALNGAGGMTKGVDSMLSSSDAFDSAVNLAQACGCCVAVTGATDFVTDGQHAVQILGGNAMMSSVTGMGCTATVVVGAHVVACASNRMLTLQDAFNGTICGLAVMATAGGMAAERAAGPGSFQMHFLDALYSMTLQDIETQVEVRLQ